MTREEIMELDMEQIQERKAQIRTEIEQAADSAALDAIEEERKAIEERIAQIEERKADMKKVAAGLGNPIEKQEENKMEVRSTKEYMHAFVNGIKTGDFKECRSLLSTNSNIEANPGQVPIPTYLEGRIQTSWQNNNLLALVGKSYVKGNLTIGFEKSATPAVVHDEGTQAPEEEVLTIGKVQIVAKNLKKWISVSDEILDSTDEEFLDYLYDELTYQIAKLAQKKIVDAVIAAPTTSSATKAGQPEVYDEEDLLSVLDFAAAVLSDEATDLTIVINRKTEAIFKAAAKSANYAMNPLEGLRVVYDNTIPAYGEADDGDCYAVLGDFARGVRANFPNGDGITITRDDYSLSEADLVKFVARQFVGFGVVAVDSFARILKGRETV